MMSYYVVCWMLVLRQSANESTHRLDTEIDHRGGRPPVFFGQHRQPETSQETKEGDKAKPAEKVAAKMVRRMIVRWYVRRKFVDDQMEKK